MARASQTKNGIIISSMSHDRASLDIIYNLTPVARPLACIFPQPSMKKSVSEAGRWRNCRPRSCQTYKKQCQISRQDIKGNELLPTSLFPGTSPSPFPLPNRCVILVVSHGDLLQTLVKAAKLQPGSNGSYFASMSQSVRTSEILSQHCQKAFDTGELSQLALEILPVSSEVNYPGSE